MAAGIIYTFSDGSLVKNDGKNIFIDQFNTHRSFKIGMKDFALSEGEFKNETLHFNTEMKMLMPEGNLSRNGSVSLRCNGNACSFEIQKSGEIFVEMQVPEEARSSFAKIVTQVSSFMTAKPSSFCVCLDELGNRSAKISFGERGENKKQTIAFVNENSIEVVELKSNGLIFGSLSTSPIEGKTLCQLQMFPSSEDNNISIEVKEIERDVNQVKKHLGNNATLQIFSTPTTLFHSVHQQINKYIGNDSHSALITLYAFLIMSYVLIPLALAIIRRMLSREYTNDNNNYKKYIDRAMNIFFVLWPIFALINVGGLTSSKNTIDYLGIKDGTFLNSGLDICHRSAQFISTKMGYLSPTKIFILTAFTAKIFAKRLAQKPEERAKSNPAFEIIISAIFTYMIQYSSFAREAATCMILMTDSAREMLTSVYKSYKDKKIEK